ncbi:LacI family DNA-binding transcriptional regulator [Clostridium sp. MD294]|uniref:LacI family DNA-binding transcriptional regulator n=1 Tax=Clostridium sp. MD294 TaxID=97138 RepID=UPI0002C8B0F8|nr:LacI family DNA-binding transcriptional regulator [Clostridium sp. MD294]NDO45285.1 substrate-binding domain-containing protein [Clostridium sp. MD294]USF31080.1 HTH-type transcriptional repressor PurR [Clostridium sp. MD294]
MAVTLQQIAELAGVSRGTVDRALNNRGRIKPEVEQKIKLIAKELGYQPSLAGRALAMAKKNIKIGVILQSAKTPFMQEVLKGLEAAKKEVENLGATVDIQKIDGINAGEVVSIMEKMKENNVSSIALSPSEDRYLMQTINQFSEEYHIPVLTFNSDLENTSRICFIGQDTKKSGQTAAGLMGEILNGNGEIMIISGYEENLSLKNRANSFVEEIELCYPDIKIIGVRYGYDDNWVAEKITEEALKEYTNIRGFYITGSGVVGVCKAIKNAQKEKEIKVIANDFIEENIHWLLNGTINFLIGQDAYTQGYESVLSLFRKFFYGEEPKNEFQYTEIFIKTKYNI